MFAWMALVSFALAQGPDVKNLQFTAHKLEGSDFKVQLTPPKDHHFNMEAPTQVEQVAGAQIEKATLEKVPSKVIASWKKQSPNCEVKAQVYICDDKNSYCVPIKKTFSCQELSGGKSLKSAAEANTPAVASSETSDVKTKLAADIFIKNDSSQAFSKAIAEKKIVLIDFFGIWCPPCNMLEEGVFSRKEFRSLGKDFVFLKMDADDPTSFQLKSKYNIKGYPTVILANAQGEEISRIVGSRKLKPFLAEMKQALKLKGLTLNERIQQAESLKHPESAFELAKMYLDQEDSSAALKYSTLGLKNGSLNDEKRQVLLSAQLGVLKELAKDEAGFKKYVSALETALLAYPTGIEAFDRADALAKVAEDLKDDSLKNRAINLKFKNAEFLLKNPRMYENSEITEADLHSLMADVYESLKDDANMKASYLKAAQAYEKEIKASGVPIEKERGHNLERLYCLFKAGQVEESMQLYEKMEAQYPEEFTFYYSHASLLKELGKKELALEKAERALKYSYGDNQLRAAHVVADLRSQTGKKKEALQLIDETLKNFPSLKDVQVRSSRYLEKLGQLKEKIKAL